MAASARLCTMRNSAHARGAAGRLTTSMTCASGGGLAEMSSWKAFRRSTGPSTWIATPVEVLATSPVRPWRRASW